MVPPRGIKKNNKALFHKEAVRVVALALLGCHWILTRENAHVLTFSESTIFRKRVGAPRGGVYFLSMIGGNILDYVDQN